MGPTFGIFAVEQLASPAALAGTLTSGVLGEETEQAVALLEVALVMTGEAEELEFLLKGCREAQSHQSQQTYLRQAGLWIKNHPREIERTLDEMRRCSVRKFSTPERTKHLARKFLSEPPQMTPEISLGVGGQSPVNRHRFSLAETARDIAASQTSHDAVREIAKQAKGWRKERRYNEAVALLNEGLRKFPNNVRLLCSMAEVYGRMGEDQKALEWFRLALSQDPDNVVTLTALGQHYYRMRRFDEALVTLQRAREIDPQYAPTYQALGYLYLKLEKDKEAAAAFARARELQSKDGGQVSEAVQRGEEEALRMQASRLRNRGRRAEEAEILQELAARFPTNGKILCQAGAAFRATRRYEEALYYYRKVFALEPKNQIALTIIGRIHLEMGREEEALQVFQQAHALAPNDTVVLTDIGGIYMRRGRYKEALAFYQQAVALNPDDVIALTNVGKAYQKMGDLDNALAYYERALVLNPLDFILLTDIGKLYLLKGQPQQALVYFQRARIGAPEDKFILTGLGEANLMMGRWDEATSFLQRVLRHNSNDRVAQNLLGRVTRREQQRNGR